GHDYKSNAIGLVLRKYWPMRLVTTLHGWVKHTRRTPFYYWLDRLCLRRYEVVISVSLDLQHECLSRGVPAHRCLLIENGIDMEEYGRRQSREEAKKKLGLDPHSLVIGAAGRLSEEKGFDVLIRSVKELLASGNQTSLVIAGDGDSREPLQDLVDSLNCRD